MKFQLALVSAALVDFATSAGLYGDKSPVVQLTTSTFYTQVLQSTSPWVVEFYAPWCGHCKQLAPHFNKAAAQLKGLVPLGAVDCDVDENKQLCGMHGVKGFPTIKIFVADKTGDKKYGADYNGERVTKAIVAAALERLPDKYVQRIGDEKTSVKVTLDDFYAKRNDSLPKVLLFSNKTQTSPLFKSLALSLKGKLGFGEVRHTEKKLVKSFAIDTFPTLLILRPGEETELYSGDMKPASLTKFLSALASGSKHVTDGSADSSDGKEEPPAPLKAPFDSNIPEVKIKADFEKECIDKSANVMSPLCIYTFLPPLEKDFPESVQQNKEMLEVITSIKKKYYEDSDKPPPYSFIWSNGVSQSSTIIINKFGLSSDLPAVLVLSPIKKLFSPYIGSFDAKNIRAFLNDVSRGKGRVFSYDETYIALPDKLKTKPAPVEHDEL